MFRLYVICGIKLYIADVFLFCNMILLILQKENPRLRVKQQQNIKQKGEVNIHLKIADESQNITYSARFLYCNCKRAIQQKKAAK